MLECPHIYDMGVEEDTLKRAWYSFFSDVNSQPIPYRIVHTITYCANSTNSMNLLMIKWFFIVVYKFTRLEDLVVKCISSTYNSQFQASKYYKIMFTLQFIFLSFLIVLFTIKLSCLYSKSLLF